MFGGVYCLKRSIKEINFITNEDKRVEFHSIQCGTQRIKSKNIVFGHGTINGIHIDSDKDAINGIYI